MQENQKHVAGFVVVALVVCLLVVVMCSSPLCCLRLCHHVFLSPLVCALPTFHLTKVFVRSALFLSPQRSQASVCQLAHSSGGDGPVHGPVLRGPEQVQSPLEAQLQKGLQRRGQQNIPGRSTGLGLILSGGGEKKKSKKPAEMPPLCQAMRVRAMTQSSSRQHNTNGTKCHSEVNHNMQRN